MTKGRAARPGPFTFARSWRLPRVVVLQPGEQSHGLVAFDRATGFMRQVEGEPPAFVALAAQVGFVPAEAADPGPEGGPRRVYRKTIF